MKVKTCTNWKHNGTTWKNYRPIENQTTSPLPLTKINIYKIRNHIVWYRLGILVYWYLLTLICFWRFDGELIYAEISALRGLHSRRSNFTVFPSLNLHRKKLSKYGQGLSGQEVNGLLELLSLSDKTIAVPVSSPRSTTSELVPVPSVVTALLVSSHTVLQVLVVATALPLMNNSISNAPVIRLVI